VTRRAALPYLIATSVLGIAAVVAVLIPASRTWPHWRRADGWHLKEAAQWADGADAGRVWGGIRMYDAETNTFGAYNANGTTRTYYKPKGGQSYWDRQPGTDPRILEY